MDGLFLLVEVWVFIMSDFSDVFIFLLVCYGLTEILMYGSILDSVRPNWEVFGCSMCLSFWVGIFLWLCSGLTNLFSFGYNPITGLFLGFASSGVVYILDKLFSDKGLNVSMRNGNL